MKRSLTFIVTDECNLRCSYCYVRKGSERLSLDVAAKALFLFLNEPRFRDGADGCTFDFIGGEPLLEADLIGEILDCAHGMLRGHPWEKNHAAGLTTNGLLYNTLPVQRLLVTNRCLGVSITVDGPADVHDAARRFPDGSGSHAQVEENARLWLHQFPGPLTSTKFTLSRNTLGQLARSVVYLLCELRVPTVNANPVFEGPWSDEDAALYEAQLLELGRELLARGIPLDRCNLFGRHVGLPHPRLDDQSWCGAGKWMLAVDPSGNLYPCNRFAPSGLSHQPPMPCGHVDVGLDFAVLDAFAALKRSEQSPPECLSCEVSGGCAWCKGHDYDESGSIAKRSTSLCLMHKARARANRTLWAEADA